MTDERDPKFYTVDELARRALERSASSVMVAELVDPDLVSLDLDVRRRAACAYLSKEAQAVLDACGRISARGGRNSGPYLSLFAQLMWNVGRGAGVDPESQEARRAADLYNRVRDLDQRGVVQVACAFLKGYLEKHPSEKAAVLSAIGWVELPEKGYLGRNGPTGEGGHHA